MFRHHSLALIVGLAGCATSAQTGALPLGQAAPDQNASVAPIAVPAVTAPIDIRVVYPPAGSLIEARDSSFLLGSVGTGDASLTINGAPVQVHPNGAWLAWVALPPGDTLRFQLIARSPRDSQAVELLARRGGWPVAPTEGLWVDTTAFAPSGRLWALPGDPVRLNVRATAGVTARLLLPDSTFVPLAEVPVDDVTPATRAFDRDTANLAVAPRAGRYAGVLIARKLGSDPGGAFPDSTTAAAVTSDTASRTAILELLRGTDTLRQSWPLHVALLDSLPTIVVLDDDVARRGDTDQLVIGRATPGATYHWFLPNGTRAILERRQNNEARIRLSTGVTTWVNGADVHPLARGTPPPLARAGSITITASQDHVTLRLPLGERIPFQVMDREDGLGLELYGAIADADWTRYPARDTLIDRVDWWQTASDRLRVDVHLAFRLWGWRTRWDGTDLLLEVRRPPRVDSKHPLRGRRILVDPGHPPGGATGPTAYREAEANLAISLRVAELLRAEGATVLLSRTADVPLDLWPRVLLADTSGAEVLVSIHNNALPDGVNPFTNNGTTVFYNHAPSLPLARAVQTELVRRMGFRDLGVARGDLALVRPTWLPSILCEGAFMMVPEQEAALRSAEGQERYAQGVVAGLRRFLARTNH